MDRQRKRQTSSLGVTHRHRAFVSLLSLEKAPEKRSCRIVFFVILYWRIARKTAACMEWWEAASGRRPNRESAGRALLCSAGTNQGIAVWLAGHGRRKPTASNSGNSLNL